MRIGEGVGSQRENANGRQTGGMGRGEGGVLEGGRGGKDGVELKLTC